MYVQGDIDKILKENKIICIIEGNSLSPCTLAMAYTVMTVWMCVFMHTF